MATSKPPKAAPPTYADLSARFDQYIGDTPENHLPSFLEALLFDSQGQEISPQATQPRAAPRIVRDRRNRQV